MPLGLGSMLETNNRKFTCGFGQVNSSRGFRKIAIRVEGYVADLYCPDIVYKVERNLELVGIQEVLDILRGIDPELFGVDNQATLFLLRLLIFT